MRSGAVPLVFAFRLDRLMRTGPGDAFRFAEECHRHGVELVTVADGVRVVPGKDDIATACLLFAFSLTGKLEAAARADRIAARRELAEVKGEAWGRPADYTAAEWERVRALKAEGRTVRRIAMAVGLTRAKVGRMLSRNTPPLPPTEKVAAKRKREAAGG
jgi:DNA invertase Pin-like site-specific DNA recombinase